MTYRPRDLIPRSELAPDVLATLDKANNIDLLVEQINFVPASGAAQVIPAPGVKRITRIILNANCVITMPAPIAGVSLFVYTEQDGVGSRVPTFPAVRWPGGAAPAATATARAVDRYEFECVDGIGWNLVEMTPDLRSTQVVGSARFLDQVGVMATGAYSLRLIVQAYAGAAVRVQRASDNTEQDIGFDGSGNLDSAALATFSSGTLGYVKTWYDQSGNGNNLTTALQANMPRIYTGSAVETENGKPVVRATDGSRGLTATVTSYGGNTLSGAVVAVMKSGSAPFSPPFLSFYGTSNTDRQDTAGALLIGRNGGTSPTAQWTTSRNAVIRSTVASTYDILQQVDAVINEPTSSYSLAANAQQTDSSAAVGNFAYTNVSIGYSGNTFLTVAGQAWGEVIFWQAALTSAQRAIVRTNQQGYFGTGQAAPPPPSSYTGALIATDNFETGVYSASNLGILNNGHMTLSGGAWMSDMVDVSGGALRIGVKLNATTMTVSNGSGGTFTTKKRGGYTGWYPSGGTRRGGVWVWEHQMPGNSLGWGFVPLLWPSTELWPQNGELDGPPEIGSGSSNKVGGGMFAHWATNAGAGSHIQKQFGSLSGIDWTVRHKSAVAWHPGTDSAGTGAYIKMFVDDVLKGQILATDAADSSGLTGLDYIPHGSNAVTMNLRLQSEGYGTPESSTVTGPIYWRIFKLSCYQLP